MECVMTPGLRRDLVLFLAGPALLTAAAATLYQIAPWPVPISAQAAILQWPLVAPLLAAGLVGVALASRIGCPPAAPLSDGRRWATLIGVSFAVGAALGAEGLAQSLWPPIAHQFDILARQSGNANVSTWVNVGLPWSIPHYLAASVLLECLYRLAPIPILTWLVSNVILRGRGQAQTYWTVAVLAAAQEPLLWGLGMVHTALAPTTATFVALSSGETFAINLLEAYGLRRFGWPAAIVFRLGYYAAARVFLPYLLSPHSVNYPGPH
jgi:hypothetical protein